MSTDPLERLLRLRDEWDRAFDSGDVEAHNAPAAPAAPESENLALRLTVNARRQLAQVRRLSEKLASSRR